MHDADGQPFNIRFNRARRSERDISEMLGLAKGVLADGEVTEAEAILLRDWIRGHPDAVDGWPGEVLAGRLERIFRDGHVDEAERHDLAELLRDLVGGKTGILVGETTATELPVDRPAPELVMPERTFVFTGKFAYGPRAACEREIIRLGGITEPGVTMRTDYLVIGTFGSRDWIQTSFGRKIEKAVQYRKKRGAPAIVAEDHWADCVWQAPP